LDCAAAPTGAVLRLGPAMAKAGALQPGNRSAAKMPAQHVRFRAVKFRYPGTSELVLDGFDLTIPAGTSLAIVGQNGAGKTTLAKLLCRLRRLKVTVLGLWVDSDGLTSKLKSGRIVPSAESDLG